MTTLPPAPEKSTAPRKRRVHKFSSFDEADGMNRLQKSFYQQVFLPAFLAGDPVDVEGQTGYGQMLINDLIKERDTDPAGARHRLEALVQAYQGPDLPCTATDVLAMFCFEDGDFAAGYRLLGSSVSISIYLTLAEHLNHPPLSVMQIINWSTGTLTKHTKRNAQAAFEALQMRLDDFQATHGVSIVTDFWRRVSADGPIDEVAAAIEDEVSQKFSPRDVGMLLSQAREVGPVIEPAVSLAEPGDEERVIAWPAAWVDAYQHGALLDAFLRALVRAAENEARDQTGVPRVGEQWKSEMALLTQLRQALPEVKFVHQFRPWWLTPQSLDIYLPAHNIAVEYQGAQHTAPVEYFGGEEKFDTQQFRDYQKRQSCKEYDCVLIEVHPGYDLADVVESISTAIDSQQASEQQSS